MRCCDSQCVQGSSYTTACEIVQNADLHTSRDDMSTAFMEQVHNDQYMNQMYSNGIDKPIPQ